MQSAINYEYYGNTPSPGISRSLKGPRPIQQQRNNLPSTWPKFPKRPPRMPIVVVSSKKFVTPPPPEVPYEYPPPALERKGSKTEILDNSIDAAISPAVSSSTKTIDEEIILPPIKPSNSNKKLPLRPFIRAKVPQKPVPAPVPITSYSTDEEDNDEEIDEVDDDEILQEIKLSRKKSVHDITISDDEEEEDEEEYSDEVDIIAMPATTQFNKSTRTDLPPIPQISAGYASTYCKPTPPLPTLTTKSSNLPPIPVISAPGYSSEEDNVPSIPSISAPGYSDDDDDMPPLPTICVPGGFSDDEELPIKRKAKKKTDPKFDSLYFGVRCGGCEEPLSGQAITTSGKHWHTYCFSCQACHQNLEHIAFYEKDGLPYCALDYHELFSPRCDFCKTPIEEHSISALDKTYHPGHFFCRECGKPFDEESNFLEHEGHAYCEKDYYNKFGKACKGCEETIMGDFLVALGGEWHKECFVCADCGMTFTSSMFLIKSGKPYCEEHYHRQSSCLLKKNKTPLPVPKRKSPLISLPTTSLNKLPEILPSADTNKEEEEVLVRSCHHCSKEIQGRFLSAFGFDYHPLHFQCSQCNKLLSARVTGLYQEGEGGELVCRPCVRKSKQLNL